MALVSHGVPFDVAAVMEDSWAAALTIVFGELDGGNFDFDRWQWTKD